MTLRIANSDPVDLKPSTARILIAQELDVKWSWTSAFPANAGAMMLKRIREAIITGTQPPPGPDWTHEIKQDGYRLMALRPPHGPSPIPVAADGTVF